MQNSSEKKAFGIRLKQQLNFHKLPDSPTLLAKEFNLRYSGNPIINYLPSQKYAVYLFIYTR